MTIEQLQNLVGKTYFNRYLIISVDLEHYNGCDKYSFTFLDMLNNFYTTDSFYTSVTTHKEIIFENNQFAIYVHDKNTFCPPENAKCINYIDEKI